MSFLLRLYSEDSHLIKEYSLTACDPYSSVWSSRITSCKKVSTTKVLDMEYADAEQDVEYKRRNGGDELQQRKRVDGKADESPLEGLTKRSTSIQAPHHLHTATAYPTMLDRVLLAVSSSAQSTLPSGIDSSTLLNNPSSVLNAITMDALRQPTHPHLYRAEFTPSLGIPNHHALSAMNSIPPATQHEHLSGLLHYFHENSAAKMHRSTLHPCASSNMAIVNAVMRNHLSPLQLFEQQLFESVSQLDSFIASGLTNGAFFQNPPAALPSLRLASEITRIADLPSVSRPLTRILSESGDSSITRSLRVPWEDEDVTQLNGGHRFFPVVLHRALIELELIRGGSDIAAFLPDGLSFQIKDHVRFENEILSCFFPRMKGFASFQRQLNLYKFRRLGGTGLNRRSYSHALFVRHHPELARNMRRTRVRRIARPPASTE